MKPWQTGLVFGITVALLYTLCTLVEALLPNQFMEWMSGRMSSMTNLAIAAASAMPTSREDYGSWPAAIIG